MFVFIHIPKIAGTSFRLAFSAQFPPHCLLLDYGECASETSQLIKKCFYQGPVPNRKELLNQFQNKGGNFIGGHFQCQKYLDIFPSATFITFLRSPLQRCFSEYLHMKRLQGETRSFSECIELPRLINLQSKMLQGLDMNRCFVGITEYYPRAISLFNKLYGTKLPMLRKNCYRKDVTQEYSQKYFSSDVISRFNELNSKDIILYSEQLERFTRVCKQRFFPNFFLN